jgi:hypothetical protein
MSRTASSSLIKHGEFVAPEIALLVSQEPANPDPDAMNGVLERFSKIHAASDNPSAMGNVSAVYADAVALMSAAGSAQMRGVGLMSLLFITAIIFWAVPFMAVALMDEISAPSISIWGVTVYIIGGYILWRFGIRMLPVLWRMDMFAADVEPTIFDRKHRKVYRLFMPIDGSGGKGAWTGKPIHLQAVEYDWDCVTAEHRVELITRGNSVARIHRLVMVARDYTKPGEKYGRILEEFEVGNAMALGETTVPMLWEHIRRYMEENGPAVPPGEPLQVFERPRNLWQSMGVVSPFGPRFGWWWRTNRFMTVFALISFPFTLPFSLLWAICNWISHMTMRKTIWPDEVHALVGEQVHPS